MSLLATHLQTYLFEVSFLTVVWLRSFLYTFCGLGCIYPNYLLAPTHCEEKQLYYKTALWKPLEAPFHSKAILPILHEHTCWTHRYPVFESRYWRLVSHSETLKNLASSQKTEIWRVTINFGVILLTKNEQYGFINDCWDLLWSQEIGEII